MEIQTDSERVRHSRKMVLEFLGSSVDMSLTGPTAPDGSIAAYAERYGADPRASARRRRPRRRASATRTKPGTTTRRRRRRGRDRRPAGEGRQRPLRPRLLEMHPLLQVRRGVRRGRPEHVRDRRRGPRLRRPDLDRAGGAAARSACVYCGNCIGVCPTGALMFKSRVRHARRRARGTSRPRRSPTRSARTAASAARSTSTSRTTRSSRSPRRSIRRSPRATSASRAASASSSSTTGRVARSPDPAVSRDRSGRAGRSDRRGHRR